MRLRGVALLLLASLAQAGTLEFRREGAVVRTIDGDKLAAACGVRTIEVDDPYYEARKQYRACPLSAVLEQGFGVPVDRLEGGDVLFHALDGYVKPSPLARVREDGGVVAFGEANGPFTKMVSAGLDPGPFYVVWTKPAQRDAHVYPWPYQLAAIEIADVEKQFPHTIPTGVPDGAPAWRGYTIFRTECIACHAVNREGGTVGPDLNVPQSIVEYRPVEQMKAYVRNPATFRYTKMPSHEYLTPDDLNALVAYFTAMKDRKHDAGAKP
jgi:mono/diheme cytochrome c family protein